MKLLWQETKWFLQQKIYIFALALTAACGYGFAIIHPSIGIDDTAMELYLQDGLVVEMGRWVMYLLNKVFYFAEFAPFVTELLGVFFLMMAAVLYCVLMRRILGERAGIVICTVFSCLFVSNPIISRVYIYYFHNGTGIGHIFTALALLCYHRATEKQGRDRLYSLSGSMVCIWVAAGCYESFLILYILGILLVIFLQGVFGGVKLRTSYVLGNLAAGAGLVIGSMLLRTMILALVIAVFRINAPDTVLGLRSLTEMFVLFRGQEGFAEFVMLVKRFWVVYHVNAFVYLPVTGYELACFCIGIYAVAAAVRHRNLWYPILFAGMLVTPFLLTVAEAKLTFYRSCQYLPFFTAVGVMVLYLAFEGRKVSRYWRSGVTFLGIVLVYNQASMLNQDFYTDYREYELARETLTGIVYDVEREFGGNVPVVFTGEYEYPYEFMKNYYVSYDSWQYKCIAAITDLVDVHLKEKYFQPEGYCFIGESNLPMIRWGFDAFDGTNRELIHFLEMHGHSLTTITDREELERAREYGDTLPGWPEEGSIVMRDGYVLVNL